MSCYSEQYLLTSLPALTGTQPNPRGTQLINLLRWSATRDVIHTHTAKHTNYAGSLVCAVGADMDSETRFLQLSVIEFAARIFTLC